MSEQVNLDVLRGEAASLLFQSDGSQRALKKFADEYGLQAGSHEEIDAAVQRLRFAVAAPQTVRIGVFGLRESGKSTLVNAILGAKVVPQGEQSTIIPTQISYHETLYRLHATKAGVDTIESFATQELLSARLVQLSKKRNEPPNPETLDISWLRVDGPFEGLRHAAHQRQLEVIDLPGAQDTDPRVDNRLRDGLERCDALVVAVPSSEPTENDKEVVSKFAAQSASRPLYLCLTKADSRPALFKMSASETATWSTQLAPKLFDQLGFPRERGMLLLTAAQTFLIAQGVEADDDGFYAAAIAKGFGEARSGIFELRDLLMKQTDPKVSDGYRAEALQLGLQRVREHLIVSARGLLDAAVPGGLCTTTEKLLLEQKLKSDPREIAGVLADLAHYAQQQRFKDHLLRSGPCCFGACEAAAEILVAGYPSCFEHALLGTETWMQRLRVTQITWPPRSCEAPGCFFPAVQGYHLCSVHLQSPPRERCLDCDRLAVPGEEYCEMHGGDEPGICQAIRDSDNRGCPNTAWDNGYCGIHQGWADDDD